MYTHPKQEFGNRDKVGCKLLAPKKKKKKKRKKRKKKKEKDWKQASQQASKQAIL